jgi:uncharacterized protein YdiU (UPF0061 family)
MRARRSSWPSSGRSSSSWWRPSWCRAFAFLALMAMLLLCLPGSRAWGQSSSAPSPIGLETYLQYQADCEIVRLQLESYRTSYEQALSVKASISEELKKAQAELQSYKESSTQSYSDLSQRVETLTRRLKESDDSVNALLSSLESKAAEYQDKLRELATVAKRLERSRNGWRAAAIGAGLLAIAAGIWAVVK